jgi:NAD(P)H-quinone oxidoreductase subunit 5
MFDLDQLSTVLGLVVVGSPLVMTCILGIGSFARQKLSERATTRLGQATIVCGLLASIGILAIMLMTGTRHVAIELGDWVVIPGHYHFSVKFVFDRLSVPFAILSYVLAGTIGAFASQYLHREPGFFRFFMLYAIFALGMIVTALAGTIETLFTGWELVGLSSALLVAFYQERPAPARNGLWIWIVYRVSDAALLLAAVVMHRLSGEGDFDRLLANGTWPEGTSALGPHEALMVGLLLLIAAAGKSGLVPFSGWLPKAMEGPTPSSAVFYGALSVHLGAFLLLRVSPLLDVSPWLSAGVVALGLSTAIMAHLAAGVQTDIKSALSFASLTQVGIIVAEVGFGLRYIALFHLLGHACVRTLQFIRAPTLLQDYRTLENAIGEHLPRPAVPWSHSRVRRYRLGLYRWALERGYLDTLLKEFFVSPFVRVFRWCDAMERRWTDFLSHGPSRESDPVTPHFGGIDELT